MRRLRFALLASCLVGVLAVITPDSAALGDVLISASGPVVTGVSAEGREIPDNGELTAEDVERLGGGSDGPAEWTSELPTGDFSTLLEDATVTVAASERRALLGMKSPAKVSDGDLAERVKDLPVVERDVFSTTYRTEEGSFISEQSAEPLNVQSNDGKWQKISTELSLKNDRWKVDNHPLSPSFSDSASAPRGVSVSAGDHVVSFSLEGAAAVRAVADASDGGVDDILRFEDVVPGMDLEYEVETGGVKETLVLSKEPRVAPAWSWSIDVGDLVPVLNEDGLLELRDAAGAVVMHVPTPVAWDSSGIEEKRSDALINPDVRLEQVEGSAWRYTISVSGAWLKDADRVYPVFVDPTILEGASQASSYKSDNGYFGGQTHVGNTRQDNTDVNWRAINTYSIAPTVGQFIGNSAVLLTYANEGTTSDQPGSIWSATNFCFHCAGEKLGTYSLGTGSAWATGDGIARSTAAHLSAGFTTQNLMIVGNEASAYTHKRLETSLYVEYWSYPSVGQVSPANGVTGQSLTPTLTVSATNYSPHSPAMAYGFKVSPNADMSAPVWDSGWSAQPQATVPEGQLQPGTTYYWQGRMYDAHSGWAGQSTERATGVRSLKTQVPPPTPPEATATPGNASGIPQTVVTLTPTLQVDAVTDPDNIPAGGTVKYEFKIATGADGKTGAVFTSGLLAADPDGKVRWTVPAGTLRDGQIYSWVVQPTDGMGKNTTPAWVKRIKVDLRLGSSGPSPFDTAGPATVNLANGNANLSFSSPLIQTLGGPIGMAFSYNSQAVVDATRGLTGAYYDGKDSLGNVPTSAAGYTFAGKTPLMVRTDSAVSFDWAAGSPGPAIANDYFMAQWTGFVRVPHASSQWRFGVRRDDGVRLRVNGTSVLDLWGLNSATAVEWSTNQNLTTAESPIQLDYYEVAGGATVELWADDLADAAGPVIVPASWFTTQRTTLPAGWGSSVPIAGDAAAWAKAAIEAQAIVLTDTSGTAHTYARTSSGGYTPPAGEYGIVSLDNAGRVVFTDEGGTVYQFAANGTVESATSAADGQKPAAPISVFNSDGTVKEIVDPLSKDGSTYHRKVSFTYQDAAQTACPAPPSGASVALVGMLCKITYPALSSTNTPVTYLYYSGGQLWMIEDPGAERTVFQYDTTGILKSIQDSTASDYLLAATTPPAAAQVSTQLVYVDGRVSTVTVPSADGIAPRM